MKSPLGNPPVEQPEGSTDEPSDNAKAGALKVTMTGNGKEHGRQLLAMIREGIEVVDSDGTRIGTVARIEGGHLKILRNDQAPRNAYQFVSPELVHSVDDRVRLSRSWDELRRLWAHDEFAKQHNLRPHI